MVNYISGGGVIRERERFGSASSQILEHAEI
jgi:hypothetical protein